MQQMSQDDGALLVPVVKSITRKFIDRIADKARLEVMRRAWDAYLGNLPEPLRTTDPATPNLNVRVNRMAPIVDTGVSWLFGEALGIEVDPDQELFATDDTPDEATTAEGAEPDATTAATPETSPDLDSDEANAGGPWAAEAFGDLTALLADAKGPINPQAQAAQDYLDGCWGDEDDRMTLLAKEAVNGAICGHHFAKILPADKAAGRQYPRLVPLDPQTVTMKTDPEDCDSVLAYTITYESEGLDGEPLMKRQCIERQNTGKSWLITNYVKAGGTQGAEWTLDDSAPPVTWPHTWAPIVDGPNLPVPNSRWGLPDVTDDLIQLNKALNFVASNINAIGYSHGHPWVWASGTNVDLVNATPGHIISLPHPDGKLAAVTAEGNIPGLMAYEADLRADMDEQSKVPAVATGRMAELPRGQMSGVAIRMLYMPLLFKMTAKRRLYGRFVREASARMLALGDFGDGTDLGGVRVVLHWQDPIPVDNLQEAQTALAWSQMGVSQETLQERAGFEPEVEKRKNEAAQARSMQLQSQGQAMLAPPEPSPVPPVAPDTSQQPAQPGQQPPATQAAPTNHPAAVRARQKMQMANGKPVTPNGM